MPQTLAIPMRALALGVAGVISACSGGGSGSGGGGAPTVTVAVVPFALDRSEPALDPANTDRVLAAALATVITGSALDAADTLEIDNGAAAPGAGRSDCLSGELVETVSVSGGTRVFELTGDQCFLTQSGTDLVLDGPVRLETSSGGGAVSGTTELGDNPSAPLIALLREAGIADFEFSQSLGLAEFDGDADRSPITAATTQLRLLAGRGTRGSSSLGLTPDRSFETLAGATGAGFTVVSVASGASRVLDLSGPLSIGGQNLNTACNFSARFNVATDAAVEVAEDGSARNGTLRFTTAAGPGAGSATVQFDGVGAARVTPSTGIAINYSASQVATFCGL